MNAPALAKIMCQVQGNDHYDTDYAPCSGCREMAEAILIKEASQPERLGLIGRDVVLVENLAKSIHMSVRKAHEHTPLRETSDRRGQWFDVRLADRRVARVTVVLDRLEEAEDAT